MKIFYVCHITNLSGASKALLNLVQVVSKDNDVYNCFLKIKDGLLMNCER